MTDEQLKERIEATLGPCKWSELKVPLLKDEILIISSELDLLDTCLIIVKDSAEEIEELIEKEQIRKPSIELINSWQKEDPELLCAIVKPFIVVQRAGQLLS